MAEIETYGDEETIKLLNKYKTGIWGDIHTGYYIREDLHRFVRRELFEGKMSMLLPLRFRKFPDDKRELLPEKPDVIYVNSSGKMQISLTDTKEEMNEVTHTETMDFIKSSIGKLNSSIVFFDQKAISQEDGTKIRWFDYKMMFETEIVYTLFFSMLLSGRFLHGKCSCEYRKAMNWKPVFVDMLKSIEIL